jgi:hypothetical protein
MTARNYFFYFLGWGGTESTITDAAKWPIVPGPDGDG